MTDPTPTVAIYCPAASREIERLQAEIEQLRKELEAPPPRPTDLVKKLEVWKQAWGTDATTGLLDTAIAEIEALRAERDWARSEFEQAMRALDGSLTGIEWKWNGRRPGSMLFTTYGRMKSRRLSRQQKHLMLKEVKAKGGIRHRQTRKGK